MISRHRARSYRACPGGPPVSRLPRRSACRRWRVESRPIDGPHALQERSAFGLDSNDLAPAVSGAGLAAHKALCLQSIDQSRYVVLGDQKALLDLDLMHRRQPRRSSSTLLDRRARRHLRSGKPMARFSKTSTEGHYRPVTSKGRRACSPPPFQWN